MKKIKKQEKKTTNEPIQNQPPQNHITNCSFVGVQWDRTSLEVVKIVAEGLNNLAKLFTSQNVQIECLMKIEDPRIEKENLADCATIPHLVDWEDK